MANLLGQNIGTNYKGILNLNTLNGNLSGTLESVTDGDGNASALQLSTSLSRISANLTIGGSTTASARLHVRGDGTNPIARFENSAGASSFTINAAGDSFNFGTTNNRLFIVNSNGNSTINGESLLWQTGITNAGGYSYRFSNVFNLSNTSGLVGLMDLGGVGLTFAAGAGSSNFRPLNIAYTINNSGAQTGVATGIFLNATETALNGMTHNLMDLQVGGSSRFRVNSNGRVSISEHLFVTGFVEIGLGNYFGMANRFKITSPSDGVITFFNNNQTDFNRLQFGGTTNAFPALKRSSAELQVRLADDSGFASLQVGDFRNNGNFNIYRTDGYHVLNYGNSANVLDFNPSNGNSLTIRMRGQTIGNLFYIKANEDRIGIGTDTPNASAILDISTTTKGFLPPRGTNAQMLAIATPATGLVFYDTTNNKLNVYDGTNWVAMH